MSWAWAQNEEGRHSPPGSPGQLERMWVPGHVTPPNRWPDLSPGSSAGLSQEAGRRLSGKNTDSVHKGRGGNTFPETSRNGILPSFRSTGATVIRLPRGGDPHESQPCGRAAGSLLLVSLLRTALSGLSAGSPVGL